MEFSERINRTFETPTNRAKKKGRCEIRNRSPQIQDRALSTGRFLFPPFPLGPRERAPDFAPLSSPPSGRKTHRQETYSCAAGVRRGVIPVANWTRI